MAGQTGNPVLTTTEAAILGVLTGGAMSGYDLKKAIDTSVGYFWGPARSGIYAVLPRLVASGFATSREVAQSGRPDKRIYRITAAGRKALRSWIEDTPAPPDPDRNPLLIKLFFGALTSPDVLSAQIRQRREEAERLDRALHQFDREADPDELYGALTRDWGHEYSRAVERWARKAEAALARAEARADRRGARPSGPSTPPPRT
jgi:PadR family transcriptional regulator, regulatory protein AphA